MNIINPQKLKNSKWTAKTPMNKEKHFMVTVVEYDEDGNVIECTLEAVITSRSFVMDWRELKNNEQWMFGWK